MKTLIISHIVEIIFSIVTSIFIFYLHKLKNQLHTYKQTQLALKSLLKDSFTRGAYTYIQRGSINKNELENMTDLHDQYKNLGGNSYTDLLYEKLKVLPIEEE